MLVPPLPYLTGRANAGLEGKSKYFYLIALCFIAAQSTEKHYGVSDRESFDLKRDEFLPPGSRLLSPLAGSGELWAVGEAPAAEAGSRPDFQELVMVALT